uniref:Ornithine decarboxylase antizyme n=1 Tax=Panagrolaimus sp. JU765 TaxID=591449 RepID=A0AC34QU97_9BILA
MDKHTSKLKTEHFPQIAGLVKDVSKEWCCHLPEQETLLLYMPGEPSLSTLSRDHFIELLELCEDVYKFKRVLVCFDKSSMNPRHGIARALNCIGFNVLPPDAYPAFLSKDAHFSMVYEI